MKTVEQRLDLVEGAVAALVEDLNAIRKELEPPPPSLRMHSRASANRILLAVARSRGMTFKELFGPSRHKEIVWQRSLAIYLARQLTSISTVVLGEMTGRDHATILHAERSVEEQFETNPKKAVEVHGWLQKLKGEEAGGE